MRARHAFTVDLEDWYQGIPIPTESRRVAQRRLRVGTDKLLAILARHQVRATFFALSSIVGGLQLRHAHRARKREGR